MDRLICRGGGVHGAAQRRRTGARLAGVIVLVLLLEGCRGGTTSGAKGAMGALAGIGDDATASADDIARLQQRLSSLDQNAFSADDWARRTAVLEQSDEWLATRVAAEVDAAVAARTGLVGASADEIVTASAQTTNQAFLRDFAAITKDLVVGAACKKILDQVAPDQRPDDPGKGSDWADAAQEAHDKLIAGWASASFRRLVDWDYYARSVSEAGTQFARAVMDDPDAYVDFATVPAVQRAVVVYLRTCYSPPRLFAPR